MIFDSFALDSSDIAANRFLISRRRSFFASKMAVCDIFGNANWIIQEHTAFFHKLQKRSDYQNRQAFLCFL
jgi:hypothetical protein